MPEIRLELGCCDFCGQAFTETRLPVPEEAWMRACTNCALERDKDEVIQSLLAAANELKALQDCDKALLSPHKPRVDNIIVDLRWMAHRLLRSRINAR